MININALNLPHCPYSEEGMNALLSAILKKANSDFTEANRSAKFAYKKAESMTSQKRKEGWIDKMYGYANEICNVLQFVVSDWYVILTDGKSPQQSIYDKIISRTNECVKDYVIEQIELYAKRKNIDLRRLHEC